MEIVVFVISVLVNGLIIGGLGRLLLPGRDPIGIPATIAVGIAAAALGGLVAYLVADEESAWIGLPLAIAFAVAIVWLLRRTRSGGDERVSLDADRL